MATAKNAIQLALYHETGKSTAIRGVLVDGAGVPLLNEEICYEQVFGASYSVREALLVALDELEFVAAANLFLISNEINLIASLGKRMPFAANREYTFSKQQRTFGWDGKPARDDIVSEALWRAFTKIKPRKIKEQDDDDDDALTLFDMEPYDPNETGDQLFAKKPVIEKIEEPARTRLIAMTDEEKEDLRIWTTSYQIHAPLAEHITLVRALNRYNTRYMLRTGARKWKPKHAQRAGGWDVIYVGPEQLVNTKALLGEVEKREKLR